MLTLKIQGKKSHGPTLYRMWNIPEIKKTFLCDVHCPLDFKNSKDNKLEQILESGAALFLIQIFI